MFIRILFSVFFLTPLFQFSQDFSAKWEGHFSFNDITEVTEGNNKIYAASGNAVFSYNTLTKELEEITTINGLSGETISTIYYSEAYKLLIIGYENGLIEIVFDDDKKVLSVVDIINKQTIPSTNKRINHFNVYNNLIYISTNYGISVYNLDRLEFGDTYFIGDNGSQIEVGQTTIFGNHLYAVCFSNGIRKALFSTSNIIDYNNWQILAQGDFTNIISNLNNLYAIARNKTVYKIENYIFNNWAQSLGKPEFFKTVDQNVVLVTKDSVYVYDENFNLLAQVLDKGTFNSNFTSATIDSENIYIGTKDYGILKTKLDNPVSFEEIHPNGPLMNTAFSIKTSFSNLWVAFGEYNQVYNPYPLNSRGVSYLKDREWVNISFDDLLDAKNLNSISVNPFNKNQVFISSFIDGLLEIKDEIPTKLYDESNSDLEYIVFPQNPDYIGDIRLGATAFDKEGLLWTISSQLDKPLKSYNPSTNEWKSYSFTDIISNRFSNLGFSDLVVGNGNTKWVASYRFGLIGFNENGGIPLIKNIDSEEANMPTDFATALAWDKRDQLWIGTNSGLRVLYNPTTFFTDNNVKVGEIVILEDGVAKELLFQQPITDIEVDSANNKWVGTNSSGAFYFSSDGQKTIFHFTKDNSPLPSNRVADISVDEVKGIVYIATEKGLVSFKEGVSSTFKTLEKTHVYPNPVRPTFDIAEKKIKIKNISENINIKITDIEGNLVTEAQSKTNKRYSGLNLEIDGGTAYWNGKNLANNTVASGVYLIMLSDLDTFETKVLKVMIVR